MQTGYHSSSTPSTYKLMYVPKVAPRPARPLSTLRRPLTGSRRMTRGHGWSLTITMRGTYTPLLFAGFYRRFRFDPIFSKKDIFLYTDNTDNTGLVQQPDKIVVRYALTIYPYSLAHFDCFISLIYCTTNITYHWIILFINHH